MSVVDVMIDPNNGIKVTDRPKALADRLGGLWEMISEVSENLPPATLRWRIQNWLAAGQGRVERGLADIKVKLLSLRPSELLYYSGLSMFNHSHITRRYLFDFDAKRWRQQKVSKRFFSSVAYD